MSQPAHAFIKWSSTDAKCFLKKFGIIFFFLRSVFPVS